MNHYANLQEHKKKQKDRLAKNYFYGNSGNFTWEDVERYEQQKAEEAALNGYEYERSKYWKTIDYGEMKKNARKFSHRKMRNIWKQDFANKDIEDIGYANENRYFDYDWTID